MQADFRCDDAKGICLDAIYVVIRRRKRQNRGVMCFSATRTVFVLSKNDEGLNSRVFSPVLLVYLQRNGEFLTHIYLLDS